MIDFSYGLWPMSGLNPICRITGQNGPAVYHDHQNLAVEDRLIRIKGSSEGSPFLF